MCLSVLDVFFMPHKLLNSVSACGILRIITRWNQHGYIVYMYNINYYICYLFQL